MKIQEFHLLADENVHPITQDTMEVLLQSNLEMSPPFILVAERKGNTISIRLRNGK